MKLSEPNILKLRLHKILLDRKIQPVRVMVTGDWHISPIISEKQLNYLKDAIVESDPDIIILQGDLIDSPIELRRETSLKKLVKELKLCAATAPTVLVLGGHDYVTPSKPPKIMLETSIRLWKKVCKRCGVKLLLNEWFEMPGLRIFGSFQDPRCMLKKNRKGELTYWDSPAGFAKNLKDIEKKMTEKLKKDSDYSGITWFAAHAPLFNNEVLEYLTPFDIASFGHMHGGIVPRGLDEIFAKFDLHFGLISPNRTPFPRRARGVMPISETTMTVINPGMIATHFCMPKLIQNMNFIKAAEVSVVEVEPMGYEEAEQKEILKEIEAVKEEKSTETAKIKMAESPKKTEKSKKEKRPKKNKKSRRRGESVESNLGDFF